MKTMLARLQYYLFSWLYDQWSRDELQSNVEALLHND